MKTSAMAWLKGVFDLLSGKAWSILLAVGGVLAGAITLFAAGRKSGKDALLKKQAQKSAKAARKANEIRDKNTAAPESDVVRRLRKYQRQ